MGINNKNMLVAGDFYEQSINLIPDVTFEEDKIEQSIARYKGFTEQISAINPSFTFDYSRHPALTIMDGENVLAIAVSPELRHSHLGTYACASAIFNSAFADKKTFDDVAKSLSLMGGDIQQFSVRKDLGDENIAVANNMFTAVKNGTQNSQKFNFLNELYIEPDVLMRNYLRIRDEETEAYLARTKAIAENISYGGEPNLAEAELKREHDKAIAENKEATREMVQNTDPDLAEELNANLAQAKSHLVDMTNKVKKHLEERNEVGKEDVYWLDKAIKENKMLKKVSDKPVFGDGFPYIRDYVVADANMNELFRVKTGLDSRVVMTHNGLMNPAARAIAQEYAIRKGFDPIHIRLPKLDSHQFSNTELVTFMKNSVIEFHENFNVPFDKIAVPKQYQKLFDEHVAEYLKNKTEIGFAGTSGPEIPVSVGSPAMDDALSDKKDDPAPAEPAQAPSQPSKPDVAPEAPEPAPKAVELPDVPVQPAPVVSEPPSPSEPAPVVDASEPAKQSPDASPVPVGQSEPKQALDAEPKKEPLAIAVSSGMFMLPSKKNEGKFILWGKENVVDNLSPKDIQTGISRLCEHHNVKPWDLIGFWKTNNKVSPTPAKTGDFLEAKELVKLMLPEPEKEYVVNSPDQFDSKSLADKEKAIAHALDTPNVLDTPAQKEREAIFNGTVGHPSELDLDAALAGLKGIEKESNNKPKLFNDQKVEDNKKLKF